MNYKIMYENAQKWVECIFPELSCERRMEAEAFFPELKESKDERIRKEILDYLLSRGFRHEWIDWLKRQGEKKSIISDDALREGIAHFGITQYQIDNWLKKYVDVEKQGEQNLANSAKICKEDEEMLDSIIEDFGNGKTSNMLQEQWLKSLKEKSKNKEL